ncbi:hypothetical protein SBOR_6693 [Sclerotinia borealis F-4128]|uniref:Uncharacterized protein n=1 Tax=Sclerotinia borealis (strain F-4128) TaxID=1432307 RepID=W9CEF7_SCLBF|nr:hypothetical protein SBOR_6693 [Sclerotinia borealis F-4128]
MAKKSKDTPSRAKAPQKPTNVTVDKTVSVTETHNANTVSSPTYESIGVDKASAKVHSEAIPSSSNEESSSAELAEENHRFSDAYSNMSRQTPSCEMCTDKSRVCGFCSRDGQNYDTWSDNTGGHEYTTDMNKPEDRIQLQTWTYETSQVTIAERLEQRKWYSPDQNF